MSDLYLMVMDLPPLVVAEPEVVGDVAGYAEIADTLRAPMREPVRVVADEGFGGCDD